VEHDEDGYTGDAVLVEATDPRQRAAAGTTDRAPGTADARPSAEAASGTADARVSAEADGGTGSSAAGAREIPVRVVLRGYVEPIDGRYHWYGRVAANDEVTALTQAGRRHVRLRTPEGEADGALSDQDTWGRYRITGTGTPPFRVVTDPPADSTTEPADPTAGPTEVSSPR
jgi:hypothetical protein